ncbi:hypothetical protein [Sporomusa acidovorans]|uniref:Uncharacterized protein n=1 Tax=Sporomusa acidovorans (strain ATCC 49682 / DSM 3132 / Mol) TaxID=1123286 RepID=A0ABZ3J7W5_SPOA4|nr:hypothetical protein [Sporomusa acidovorans]OZC19483.1 hypothetical protein SPACI_28450 [Sporomusa acidovorans DSM 3132]SDF80854.1 hypothetical protein SAMN04488499_10879 [Sporomusa acidovorans]
MPKGYFLRCGDCGYLYECEEDLLECANKVVCDHCGSSNLEVIQQQEGRFGCTSRMNTHVVNVNAYVDHPQPVQPSDKA